MSKGDFKPVKIYIRTSNNTNNFFVFDKSMVKVSGIEFDKTDWQDYPHITKSFLYNINEIINFIKKTNNPISELFSLFFNIFKIKKFLKNSNATITKNNEKNNNSNIENNIYLLLYVIFRTQPISLQHFDSYTTLFEMSSNVFLKNKLMAIKPFDNTLFSYIGGNTINQVYWINDFINQPLYGDLIGKYEEFQTIKNNDVRKKLMELLIANLKILIVNIDTTKFYNDTITTIDELIKKYPININKDNDKKISSMLVKEIKNDNNKQYIENVFASLKDINVKYFLNVIDYLLERLISIEKPNDDNTMISNNPFTVATTKIKDAINTILKICNSFITLPFIKIKKYNPTDYLEKENYGDDIAEYLKSKKEGSFLFMMKTIHSILLATDEVINIADGIKKYVDLSLLSNGFRNKILNICNEIYARHLVIHNFLTDEAKISMVNRDAWFPLEPIPDTTKTKFNEYYPEELIDFSNKFRQIIISTSSTNQKLQNYVNDIKAYKNSKFMDIVNTFSKIKNSNTMPSQSSNDYQIINDYGNVGVSILTNSNSSLITYQIYLHINVIKGELNSETIKPFLCDNRSHKIGNFLRGFWDKEMAYKFDLVDSYNIYQEPSQPTTQIPTKKSKKGRKGGKLKRKTYKKTHKKQIKKLKM
jgi:hypothetical protein